MEWHQRVGGRGWIQWNGKKKEQGIGSSSQHLLRVDVISTRRFICSPTMVTGPSPSSSRLGSVHRAVWCSRMSLSGVAASTAVNSRCSCVPSIRASSRPRPCFSPSSGGREGKRESVSPRGADGQPRLWNLFIPSGFSFKNLNRSDANKCAGAHNEAESLWQARRASATAAPLSPCPASSVTIGLARLSYVTFRPRDSRCFTVGDLGPGEIR